MHPFQLVQNELVPRAYRDLFEKVVHCCVRLLLLVRCIVVLPGSFTQEVSVARRRLPTLTVSENGTMPYRSLSPCDSSSSCAGFSAL